MQLSPNTKDGVVSTHATAIFAEEGRYGETFAGKGVGAHPPVVRPSRIANAAPLGNLGFGMTTVSLQFINTHWAEPDSMSAVITFACFCGGLAQMVAGTLELIKGNSFSGTAFFSFGAFWMAFFTQNVLVGFTTQLGSPPFVPATHFHVGQTLMMALWALFTAGFFVPTLRKNACLVTVFGTLTLTYALLAGAQWSGACATAAGYVGMVCGASAIYTAFAELWQETLGVTMPGMRPVRWI